MFVVTLGEYLKMMNEAETAFKNCPDPDGATRALGRVNDLLSEEPLLARADRYRAIILADSFDPKTVPNTDLRCKDAFEEIEYWSFKLGESVLLFLHSVPVELTRFSFSYAAIAVGDYTVPGTVQDGLSCACFCPLVLLSAFVYCRIIYLFVQFTVVLAT